jgi:hypothetical protein
VNVVMRSRNVQDETGRFKELGAACRENPNNGKTEAP